MKICIWHSEKSREIMLAEAILEGLKGTSDTGHMRLLLPEKEVADCDVAFMVGVKSYDLWSLHQKAGVNTIMLDKGYIRNRGPARSWLYWRVAVNAHNASYYIGKAKHSDDRWRKHKMHIKPWRTNGKQIVFAGSSAKYHKFHRLPEPTPYAQKICKHLHKLTSRPVVYRPKPSWREAVPVPQSEYSAGDENINQALENAWCLVTHGSNACYEAVLNGIPCVILGDAIAKSISATHVNNARAPTIANDKARRRWFANLAYCQWTLEEFASGEAWEVIRPQLFGGDNGIR